MTSSAAQRVRLDEICLHIERSILVRQHPVTGLLPASTAVTVHGDYTDAWVRDNVYTILCAWGAGMALRKRIVAEPSAADARRAWRFEQAVVKTMRGLLVSMMKQAGKVERFKRTLDPRVALHAKYSSHTGDPVVADDGWGHLQIDATSIFLLMLAQMTAAGLRLVFTPDEVDFVQNLVHYVARAYHTPDYGIWERGDKANSGFPEVNSSSVGMAKAALESMRGLDLFGGAVSEGASDGAASESVIHVLADDIARMRNILEATLPRESRSKEVDAALLSVVGYPAFAVDDGELAERVTNEVIDKLQGWYGCKRFLRDGHQTELEDHRRMYYESGELAVFDGIESEWPLFFTYLMLDGLMLDRPRRAHDYRDRLAALTVEKDGMALLPELYYVPHALVAAEKAMPGSQKRLPNANVPLYWAQSLYWLGLMIDDGVLAPADLDPLGRRLALGRRRDVVPQVALIAGDADVQAQLAIAGVASQSAREVAPVRLRRAVELAEAFTHLGANQALGLQGRPLRNVGSLVTCQVFDIDGAPTLFLPQFMETQDFYLNRDNRVLVARCKAEFSHVRRHWDQAGEPLFTVLVTHTMLAAERAGELMGFLRELCRGRCDDMKVHVAPLAELLPLAGHEALPTLPGLSSDSPPALSLYRAPQLFGYDADAARPLEVGALQHIDHEPSDSLVTQLRASQNPYEDAALLTVLAQRHGLAFVTSGSALNPDGSGPKNIAAELEATYSFAVEIGHWGLMRHCAGVLDKHDPKLEDAVANIVGHGKQLSLGRGYSVDAVIATALDNQQIASKLRQYGGDDPVGRMLVQEIVIFLATLIKVDPRPFQDLLTLRAWQLLLLIVGQYAWDKKLQQAEAYQKVQDLSPSAIFRRLQAVVVEPDDSIERLASLETLHRDLQAVAIDVALPVTLNRPIVSSPLPANLPAGHAGWLSWRERSGVLTRLPKRFYERVWRVLARCKGLVVGDRLDVRSRLDSALTRADTTASETNFALTVERMLAHIQAPEYRQLCIEALYALADIFAANPDLNVADDLVLDVLIGHAVRLAWFDAQAGEDVGYDSQRAQAWTAFYGMSPPAIGKALDASFEHLLSDAVAA
ncbi:MAG: glycosyl hydrolase family 15 [Rhizobacter sp.]|nr:glycosyl hydrolase family 15 [Rhizobacter sp.]